MTFLSRVISVGRDRLGPAVAQRQPKRVDFPLSQFGLRERNGHVTDAHGVVLRELVDEFGSPLHVIQADALRMNAAAAMAPSLARRGADVFFSYKTNPVPAVLERIHRSGMGAEVISAYEYWLARRLGVPGHRIIYNGPAKSAESVAAAIEDEAFLINANSAGDLASIAAQAAAVGKRANVGIRVALPGMWAGQFGMDSASLDVLSMVTNARASADLTLRALHFHRGITMRRIDEVEAYLDDILRFVDYLGAETGWYPEVLDVGGSLSCPTTSGISTKEFRLNRALGTDITPPDPRDCVTVGQMAEVSQARIHTHFAARDIPVPQVVLEPGRAVVADTHFLLTSVLDVKADGEITHLVADAGTNIAESVTNEFHQLFNLSNMHGPADQAYRIAGPICTPADVTYNNWRMAKPAVGDVLAIMDTGAYCIPFSTSFSFPRPPIVLLDGGRATVVRRGETFEDLIGRDIDLRVDEPK